jgi:hypothetical protein
VPYFVSFLWRGPHSTAWNPIDMVMSEHPVDYIMRARRTADPGYEYRLLFFCEIPVDVYEKHRPPVLE